MEIFKTWENSKALTLLGITVVLVAGYAFAGAGDDVLERISPIGRVNIAKAPIAQVAVPVAKAVAPAVIAAPTAAPVAVAVPTTTPTAAPVAVAVPHTVVPASAPIAPVTVASAVSSGKKTYDAICFSCHATGVANAPKPGDKEAWAPRIAKGEAALLESTINGKPPMMPARGTCGVCTDDDLKAALEYMVSQSK